MKRKRRKWSNKQLERLESMSDREILAMERKLSVRYALCSVLWFVLFIICCIVGVWLLC